MIFNLYVFVVLAIALFTLAVGSYTVLKAYKIGEEEKTAVDDKRYELEKDFYLVSTVGGITLITRIVAIPLFFITVLSLIPSVPSAMCEFGVFQAGSPYSWIDFGLKLVTVFVFGGWLFIHYANGKVKSSPLMGSLSRGFVMMMPLVYLDAIFDILFFGSLKPLVVPCCMVIYSPLSSVGITCPFCLVTFQMPLLLGVIPAYFVALGLVLWSFKLRGYSIKYSFQKDTSPLINKALIASMLLATIGTLLLVIQVLIGPLGVG